MENHPDRNIEPDIDRHHLADRIYTCAENGDIFGAIDCLDRAIEIEPDCAYLYAERAIDRQPLNQLFKQWHDSAKLMLG